MERKVEIWDLPTMYSQQKPLPEIHAGYLELIEREPSKLQEMMESAIKNYDHVAIKMLFNAGYNPLTVDDLSFTLLHHLARDPSPYNPPVPGVITECVNLLLDNKVSVLKKDTNEGLCCYHYAARDANVEYVHALRIRGAKLDMTGQNGNTALHELAEYFGCNGAERPGQEELAQRYVQTANEFISAGIDIDAKNDYGLTAGKIVIDKKAVALYKLLVTDPNVFQAIEMKAYDSINELAAGDPNVIRHEEYARFDKLSALGAACVVADPIMVQSLFKAGADANFKNDAGDTALVALLATNNPGYDSLKENHYARVLDLFAANGWDKDSAIDEKGNTLLTAAIDKNFSSSGYNYLSSEKHTIEWLMAHGANVNIANASNQTPLMLACKGNNDDMESIQLSLLENGADVLVRDVLGKTALHYAAMNGRHSLGRTFADLIFAFGKVDTSLVDSDGKTALDIATENNNEELVKYLLTKV